MKAYFIAMMATVLAGCTVKEDADSCGADIRQHLIGQTASILNDEQLPENVRILQFGQMMTMDHNPGRLNIQSDTAGLIARIWCG